MATLKDIAQLASSQSQLYPVSSIAIRVYLSQKKPDIVF